MNEREQKIDGITAAVVAELAGSAGNVVHYQECWKRHAYCLALLVQEFLHDDVR